MTAKKLIIAVLLIILLIASAAMAASIVGSKHDLSAVWTKAAGHSAIMNNYGAASTVTRLMEPTRTPGRHSGTNPLPQVPTRSIAARQWIQLRLNPAVFHWSACRAMTA
jgi:hypothetical protein